MSLHSQCTAGVAMSAKGVGTLKVVNGHVRLIYCDLKNDGNKLCGNDFKFISARWSTMPQCK